MENTLIQDLKELEVALKADPENEYLQKAYKPVEDAIKTI